MPQLVLTLALGTNLVFVLKKPWQNQADLFRAQDWVRNQADLTGLAIQHNNTGRFATGTYLVLDRRIPLVFQGAELPSSRIVSHLIACDAPAELAEGSPAWEQLVRFGRFLVFRRKDRLINASGG
jgi:hypothetical protein